MMRPKTYAGLSLIATLAITYHAFNSRGQFYPAMLTKKVFLGSPREAKVERLNERSWREIMEILFAITIFRQDFSVTFLAMATALLLIQALHCSLKHLLQTWQPSVSIFFSFEYMILATITVSVFVKYLFYISTMLMEGQWERKPIFTFYLELIRDLLHLSTYLFFFLVIFINYGVPLHLIRVLYETFRNFKVRVEDYIRYCKITSNMKDRFPEATPEEHNASDAPCIICREEMTVAKKLICGHLFHVHCLRSWLERQHTCPTCRALVVPPENGATATGGQQGAQSDAHRQGTGTSTGSSAQNEVGGGGATDNLSRHQARLQAAAAAVSIYENSYVYPSTSSLVCSPGYALLPLVQMSLGESINTGLNEEQASSEQAQKPLVFPGGPIVSFPQMGHFHLFPSQTHPVPANHGMEFGVYPNMPSSHLEAQRKLLQYQIEILQNQLQLFAEDKRLKIV
ncbi:hypothetical protein AAHE18_05G125900 [Arachis hypogaea]